MQALQRAIAHACLGIDAGERIANDPRAFFAAHGAAPEDIEAILASPRTLLVYRSLVRNGLSSIVLRMLPRTRARLNAACPGRFDADLASFLDEAGPRTHYLRDVPAELFAWAEPRWRSDSRAPPYVSDLASFELAHFAVAASESAHAADGLENVALDRPLAFIESARIAHYLWAVHELSVDEGAIDEPQRRDVHLLAYRNAIHAVRWLELTPLASAILERLLSGDALGAAVQHACASRGAALAGSLEALPRLLADLGARGVLVGARRRPLADQADAR
jgi:hypothetical protein